MATIPTPKNFTTAQEIYEYPAFGRICTIIELFKIHFAKTVSRCPLNRDTRWDPTDYIYDSPFTCNDIERLVINKDAGEVHLSRRGLNFPHGRGVTWSAFDPLSLINALLKSTPVDAQEDNFIDWVYEKMNTDKQQSTFFYNFLGFTHPSRRPHRIIDDIILRVGVNTTTPLTSRNFVPSERSERYPLARLIHDCILLTAHGKELHPECLNAQFADFFANAPLFKSLPTIDSVTPSPQSPVAFPPALFPPRGPKTVTALFSPLQFSPTDCVGTAIDWSTTKSIKKSFQVYPDESNYLRWYIEENVYFQLPVELVTPEMIQRAYEYEKKSEELAKENNEYYNEERMTSIESTQRLIYDVQPYELATSTLLDLILEILLHGLRFSTLFEEVFNEHFVDLTDDLRQLFFKTKQMQLLEQEYLRLTPIYQKLAEEREEAGLNTEPGVFLDKIDYVDEDSVQKKPKKPAGRAPKATADKANEETKKTKKDSGYADSDDEDGNDDTKSDTKSQSSKKKSAVQPMTKEEMELRDEYDFVSMEWRILDLEQRRRDLSDELHELSISIHKDAIYGNDHYSFLDLVRTKAQNVYVDQEMGKKYTLYTNTSLTYVHLYEEPLLIHDILPPVPAHAQDIANLEEEDRIKKLAEEEEKALQQQQATAAVEAEQPESTMDDEDNNNTRRNTRQSNKKTNKKVVEEDSEDEEESDWEPNPLILTTFQPDSDIYKLTDQEIDSLLNPEQNDSFYDVISTLESIDLRTNHPVQVSTTLKKVERGANDDDILNTKNTGNKHITTKRYFKPIIIAQQELQQFLDVLNIRLTPPKPVIDEPVVQAVQADEPVVPTENNENNQNEKTMEDDDNFNIKQTEAQLPPLAAPPTLPDIMADDDTKKTKNTKDVAKSNSRNKKMNDDDDDDDEDEDEDEDNDDSGDEDEDDEEEEEEEEEKGARKKTTKPPTPKKPTATSSKPKPTILRRRNPPSNNTTRTALADQRYGFLLEECDNINDPSRLLIDYANFCAQYQHLPALPYGYDEQDVMENFQDELGNDIDISSVIDERLAPMAESVKKQLMRATRHAGIGTQRHSMNTPRYAFEWTLLSGSIIMGGMKELYDQLTSLKIVANKSKQSISKRTASSWLSSSIGYGQRKSPRRQEEDLLSDSSEDEIRPVARGGRNTRNTGRRGDDDDKYNARNTDSSDDDEDDEDDDDDDSEDDRSRRRAKPRYRDESSEDDDDSDDEPRRRNAARNARYTKPQPTGRRSRRLRDDESESSDEDEDLRRALELSKREAKQTAAARPSRVIVESETD